MIIHLNYSFFPKVSLNLANNPDLVGNRIAELKIKTQLQLNNFCQTVRQLNKRLQNVFIVNDNFKKIAKIFDDENNLIVLPALSEEFEEVLKESRHSKIILFIRDKKVPYKKLKMLGMTNLAFKKDILKNKTLISN